MYNKTIVGIVMGLTKLLKRIRFKNILNLKLYAIEINVGTYILNPLQFHFMNK